MKEFKNIVFDPDKCRQELKAFGKLLQSKKTLAERTEIQPFFKKRQQLTAFMGTFVPDIGPAQQIAYEFPIFGDFTADIVIGNREAAEFCFIELEDAGKDSIFATVKPKSTKEWARRFEHGFSQLVDWFYSLDDLKKTDRFAKDFGHGRIKFFGLLLIGRNAGMSDADRSRLDWRTEKVLVDSHHIYCLTYDDLYQLLLGRMSYYPQKLESE